MYLILGKWSVRTCALCLIAFIFCTTSFGQSTGDIPFLTKEIDLNAIADTSVIDDAIGLEPVTITFSKGRDLRSPQNIRLISPTVKAQFGRQSLPQILNTTPGVLMHSGALNTNRITIRGIGSRNLFGTAKIKAYLNDIPLTNGQGETSIEDIDLSLIDNINIVRGPTSSLYGAGLGGMIQLSTRSNTVKPSSLSLAYGIGNYGLQTTTLRLNLKISDDHRIIANVNDMQSDGYRSNNNYDRTGFALIGDHKINQKVRLSWIANYIDLVAQIPSSLNFTDYIEEPTKAAFTWQSVNGFEDYTKFIGGVSAAIQTSEKSVLKASLFTNTFQSYESRPFNILEEDNTAFGIRSTFLQSINSDFDLTVGLEGFSEKYKWQTYITNDGTQGNQISDNEEDRKYINVFANANYSISDKINLIGGFNFNSTNYDYRDLFLADMEDLSGTYNFDAVISPYLHVNVDVGGNSIESSSTLYGLLSHGFSPPSLEETILPDGQINPDIQPERGLNVEFGLKGQMKSSFLYSVSVYSMRVKDLLVARRTAADQFIGINAGKTLHNGLEASLGYQWDLGKFKFKINTDLSLHDYSFKEFVDGDNDFSGNPLTGTPSHVWRTQLDITPLEGLNMGIGHYTLGDQPLRDDNSVTFDGYTLSHAYLKYSTAISDRIKTTLLFRAENIFDQKHASMLLINAGSFGGRAPRYYYPGLPSNYFGSVKLSFRL